MKPVIYRCYSPSLDICIFSVRKFLPINTNYHFLIVLKRWTLNYIQKKEAAVKYLTQHQSSQSDITTCEARLKWQDFFANILEFNIKINFFLCKNGINTRTRIPKNGFFRIYLFFSRAILQWLTRYQCAFI